MVDDFVVISDSDSDKEDVTEHRENGPDEQDEVITHTIGFTIKNVIKINNGVITGEARSLDIYYSENVDPSRENLVNVAEEAIREMWYGAKEQRTKEQ